MNDKNLIRNIKILLIFFSLCFFSMIVYLTYFDIFVADKIANDTSNQRVRLEESKILRGSILDRDGDIIVYSEVKNGKDQRRVYKYGEEFAHLTGYNSYKYGKSGIELAYNDVLIGRASASYDMVGNFFKGLREFINKDTKRGDDVYLTIDKNLQNKAFNVLGNDRGAVVVLNPKTGEILAMVSKPSFNPQDYFDDNTNKIKVYNSEQSGAPQVNRAVSGNYTPGSTFKIITTASALENIGNINKKYFNCTGKLKIGNYVLSDAGGEAHGRLDLQSAFRVSCNSTFGQIGMELGYDKLKNTAENFMFNGDISFNDEYSIFNVREGSIDIKDEKDRAYLAQSAIGQGEVTASPLQMALVASSIANDGVMMKPYVVKEIKDRYDVSLYQAKPEKLTSPVSKDVADKIKGYMEEVVKEGTGKNARISGIKIAGKTGTAEVGENQEPHSWFVGFAPVENPQIAFAVIVENGGAGGKRAAEIAREVMRAYFKK
ncbi:peptidoglycan D,D-transpeptidase FtsI family protein [Fonticella tunisiensis]|uniref:Cell elongation-specific peptidoglycan D,D-transpeptidase n=1 Tax=Fonticella tunisiensis TaxID=1096341 RepID=A0A4R7KUG5_9CLOT|nr:penicillin-binding transpeptidase domain-containing protein [Fonticella tunisiensis]TDT63723.1 cell elongation-specific peptidoglycan D,D-transpeptidase [Fonticella tunisiensis]